MTARARSERPPARRIAPRRAHLTSRRWGERTSELAPRIDALFSALDQPGHPGGMIAVLRGGRVVHRAAYGVASVEHDLPFDDRVVLRLGSTSKHVAATAILLLEDRGLLALDDDVRRHLPELPDLGVTITLRHLGMALSESHDLPKKQVNAVLEDMVTNITKHLKKGARIRIGGLGILQVRKRPARMGRNPATGEAIKIKASKKVAFRAAKELKNSV